MLRAMPEFAVTAIGRDRPGIVAAISEAILFLDRVESLVDDVFRRQVYSGS